MEALTVSDGERESRSSQTPLWNRPFALFFAYKTMVADASSAPNQFRLRTLLLAVGFVAMLCSIGVCTRWFVPVGIGVAVAVGAVTGRLIARRPRGAVRGAAWGLRFSFLAIAAMSGHLFYTGWCVESRPKTQPYDATHRQAVDKLLKAVKAIVPSAHGIANDAKLKDSLAGCYEDDLMGLAGDTMYLFPDGTYLCSEWADILPMQICDRGLWECEDGVLTLHSDGDLVATFTENMDAVYLPLTLVADEDIYVLKPLTKGQFCVMLLGLDRELGFFQEAMKKKDSVFSKVSSLLLQSRLKTKTIEMDEIATMKRDLYARSPPEFDRAVSRDKLLKHGMGMGLIAIVLAAAHVARGKGGKADGRIVLTMSQLRIGAALFLGNADPKLPRICDCPLFVRRCVPCDGLFQLGLCLIVEDRWHHGYFFRSPAKNSRRAHRPPLHSPSPATGVPIPPPKPLELRGRPCRRAIG